MAQDKKEQPNKPQPGKTTDRSSGSVEYGENVSNTYKPPVNPHNTGKTPDKGKK